MPQTLKGTLEFLEDLRFNNQKTWFDENRSRYQQARAAFESVVEDLMRQFNSVEDLGSTSVKDCLYRINRDIRFSKDKSPYNAHMAALIANGGRKSEGRGYYIHIEPGASMVAGGVYMPTPEQLHKIRRKIADHPHTLPDILAHKDFVRYYGAMEGEKLKTAPKGFASDHPAIELLKYKQFLASHKLKDEDVLSDGFAAYVIAACAALKPFAGFLQEAMQA